MAYSLITFYSGSGVFFRTKAPADVFEDPELTTLHSNAHYKEMAVHQWRVHILITLLVASSWHLALMREMRNAYKILIVEPAGRRAQNRKYVTFSSVPEAFFTALHFTYVVALTRFQANRRDHGRFKHWSLVVLALVWSYVPLLHKAIYTPTSKPHTVLTRFKQACANLV